MVVGWSRAQGIRAITWVGERWRVPGRPPFLAKIFGSGEEIGIVCDRLYTDLTRECVGESLPVDPNTTAPDYLFSAGPALANLPQYPSPHFSHFPFFPSHFHFPQNFPHTFFPIAFSRNEVVKCLDSCYGKFWFLFIIFMKMENSVTARYIDKKVRWDRQSKTSSSFTD